MSRRSRVNLGKRCLLKHDSKFVSNGYLLAPLANHKFKRDSWQPQFQLYSNYFDVFEQITQNCIQLVCRFSQPVLKGTHQWATPAYSLRQHRAPTLTVWQRATLRQSKYTRCQHPSGVYHVRDSGASAAVSISLMALLVTALFSQLSGPDAWTRLSSQFRLLLSFIVAWVFYYLLVSLISSLDFSNFEIKLKVDIGNRSSWWTRICPLGIFITARLNCYREWHQCVRTKWKKLSANNCLCLYSSQDRLNSQSYARASPQWYWNCING